MEKENLIHVPVNRQDVLDQEEGKLAREAINNRLIEIIILELEKNGPNDELLDTLENLRQTQDRFDAKHKTIH